MEPVRLYTASDVATRPCPIPRVAGVYGWYFTQVPPGVPTIGCHTVEGSPLLYVGISPKAPPADRLAASRQASGHESGITSAEMLPVRHFA